MQGSDPEQRRHNRVRPRAIPRAEQQCASRVKMLGRGAEALFVGGRVDRAGSHELQRATQGAARQIQQAGLPTRGPIRRANTGDGGRAAKRAVM
jgi:hypothetical protein